MKEGLPHNKKRQTEADFIDSCSPLNYQGLHVVDRVVDDLSQ